MTRDLINTNIVPDERGRENYFTGHIGIDFQDVSNILKDPGIVLVGSGEGRGPDRLEQAVKATFEGSPLSDYDLATAKNVIINITSGGNKQGLMMSELERLDEMIAHYTGSADHFKKGIGWSDDPEFGDKVRINAIVNLGGLVPPPRRETGRH